nr:uncharacterized protein LOC116424765 [Nomia melanderi]
MVLLMLYEFLVAAFFLEFALACVWTPINALLVTTMPRAIYHVLRQLEFDEVAVAFSTNKSLMVFVTYTVTITFFLLTLYITDAVDYTIVRDEGMTDFMIHMKEKLWEKLQREIPFLNVEVKPCRCKVRRSGLRRNRANSN